MSALYATWYDYDENDTWHMVRDEERVQISWTPRGSVRPVRACTMPAAALDYLVKKVAP